VETTLSEGMFHSRDANNSRDARNVGNNNSRKYGNSCARIYRPSFCENKPKTFVFSHRKRAFSACFGENWVYKFGHSSHGANSRDFSHSGSSWDVNSSKKQHQQQVRQQQDVRSKRDTSNNTVASNFDNLEASKMSSFFGKKSN
jgi:hypothetical protein